MKNSNDTIWNRTRDLNQLRHRVPRVPPKTSVIIHELSWRSIPEDSRVFITNTAITSQPVTHSESTYMPVLDPFGQIWQWVLWTTRATTPNHFERSVRALVVTVQKQRNKTTP